MLMNLTYQQRKVVIVSCCYSSSSLFYFEDNVSETYEYTYIMSNIIHTMSYNLVGNDAARVGKNVQMRYTF